MAEARDLFGAADSVPLGREGGGLVQEEHPRPEAQRGKGHPDLQDRPVWHLRPGHHQIR